MAEITLDNLDIHSTDLYLTRGYPFEEWDLLRKEAPGPSRVPSEDAPFTL